jgi:hypothetical protein
VRSRLDTVCCLLSRDLPLQQYHTTTHSVHSGCLRPPGGCNVPTRKLHDCGRGGGSVYLAGDHVHAAAHPPRESADKEEIASGDGNAEHCVAAGSSRSPRSGAEGTPTPCVGSQKKRPRTKAAALRSQSLFQQSNTDSPTPCPSQQHQQVSEAPGSAQAAAQRDPQHNKREETLLRTEGVDVGHSLTPIKQSSVATPHARRPRTKRARLEAKNSASKSSQSPACTPSSSRPSSHSPVSQDQQENVALQPGDPAQAASPETSKHLVQPPKLEDLRPSTTLQSTRASEAQHNQTLSDG